MAESLNRAIKPERQEVALKQGCLLWDRMVRIFFEKRELAESTTTPFPPKIMAKLKRIEEKASLLIANPSSEHEVRVTDYLGRQFLVQFEPEWMCSCGDWQDIGVPCVHAWRACTRLNKRQYNYISPYYSTEVFKQTYSYNLPAIMYTDLVPNECCGPPLIRRKRGRPTEKARVRFAEVEPSGKKRRCTECKEIGHNTRTCPLREEYRSQQRGKGPTADSDADEDVADEDVVNNTNETLQGSDSVNSDSESSADPDPEFTVESIAARKEAYVSDKEDRPAEVPSEDVYMPSQDVIDVSLSQPGEMFSSQLACSPFTSFSELLASFLF